MTTRWRTSVSVDPARIGQGEITRSRPDCDEHEQCQVMRWWVQWDGAIHETHYRIQDGVNDGEVRPVSAP